MAPEFDSSVLTFIKKMASLNQADAEFISTCFESVCLRENDYFLKAGMPVLRIGYLIRGILRVFTIDTKGNEVISHFISEEHFFADLEGIFLHKPSGTYVQAVTRCHILTITLSKLEMLKQTTPGLELFISQIREQTLCERILNSHFLRNGDSTEQYHYFITHFPQVAQQVPLKDIASFLRITQQSLSRIRRQTR